MRFGLACPECGSFDIRSNGYIPSGDGMGWRRKICNSCGFGFKTVEVWSKDLARVRPDLANDFLEKKHFVGE